MRQDIMTYYAVFDIGGTSVKHAVIDEQGNFHSENKMQTPKPGNDEIYKILTDQIEQDKINYKVKGVALSVPGAVDIHTGHVYYTGSVMDFMGQNMKEKLASVGLPIECENDAHCAALAEKWQGNAIDVNNFICITVGTGIGGALFLNGDIYRGKRGMAGEVGLMMLHNPSYTLPEQLANVIHTETLSRLGSTWNLLDRLRKKNIHVTGQEVFKLYEAQHKDVRKELDALYNALAVGICNIAHSIAPEKIIIGGGISQQPSFLHPIKDRVTNIAPTLLEWMELEHCRFYNQAGLVGALYHFLKMQAKLPTINDFQI
ncbi:ROK family protein [Longirhabdus pacifica]|uniref:ROK family protein n=1 Tax=Longirhabdus pacifica TaxID=2305227 RepID=UPI001008F46A|nr:ROK family protein [Longirhabdus pacifica]